MTNTRDPRSPDEYRHILTLDLFENAQLRFALVRYGRRWRLDIRRFVRYPNEQDYTATKRGAFIDSHDLRAVIRALQRAADDIDAVDDPAIVSEAPAPSQAPFRGCARIGEGAGRDAKDSLALAMRERGESLSAIAQAIGVSKATVSRRLARLKDAEGISSVASVPRSALHEKVKRNDATADDAAAETGAPMQ